MWQRHKFTSINFRANFFCWQREFDFVVVRVTGLGEFSANETTVYFGQFSKITKASQILGCFFQCQNRVCGSLAKQRIGQFFRRFFYKLIWSPCCCFKKQIFFVVARKRSETVDAQSLPTNYVFPLSLFR
jgi:hypothetical protein